MKRPVRYTRELLSHWRWLLLRALRGPATRRAWCLDCGVEIEQAERSPGIWRPLMCGTCWRRDVQPKREAA